MSDPRPVFVPKSTANSTSSPLVDNDEGTGLASYGFKNLKFVKKDNKPVKSFTPKNKFNSGVKKDEKKFAPSFAKKQGSGFISIGKKPVTKQDSGGFGGLTFVKGPRKKFTSGDGNKEKKLAFNFISNKTNTIKRSAFQITIKDSSGERKMVNTRKTKEDEKAFQNELSNTPEVFKSPSVSLPIVAPDLIHQTSQSISKFDLVYVTSVPLVLQYRKDKFYDVAKVNILKEQQKIEHTMKEAGWKVRYRHAIATQERLREVFTDGAKVVHFSGHGQSKSLILESPDQPGLAAAINAEDMRHLLSAGGENSVQVVFVSACHSKWTGDAFVKCEVPHVVAVRTENEISDEASIRFTKHFYYALFKGRTVQEAFDIGKAIIHTGDFYLETDKFILLPADKDHNVQIFGDEDDTTGTEMGFKDLSDTPIRNFLHRRNQSLRGRNELMYKIISTLHSSINTNIASVWLYGNKGMGKTDLLTMSSHYMKERRIFSGFYYLDLKESYEDSNNKEKPDLMTFITELFKYTDVFDDDEDPAGFEEFLKQLKNACKKEKERLKLESPFLLIIDHLFDLWDEDEPPTVQQKEEWEKNTTKFIDKLLHKCNEIRLLIGSRDKFKKQLKTEYEVFEVVGVEDKAAKKILEDKFMNTSIRQDQLKQLTSEWVKTSPLDKKKISKQRYPNFDNYSSERQEEIVQNADLDIFEFIKKMGNCPGFIVDMCFTFKIETDRHIREFDYLGPKDFAPVLKDYPKQIPDDFDMPHEEEPPEEAPEPVVVPGQAKFSPRSQISNTIQRQISSNQKPIAQQQHNEPGAALPVFHPGSPQRNKSQKHHYQGEGVEAENMTDEVDLTGKFEEVLRLREQMKKMRDQKWKQMKNDVQDECPIDEFLTKFRQSIHQLINGFIEEEVYNTRPISEHDQKQILVYFREKRKVFTVSKSIFLHEVWLFFQKLFESIVLIKRFYYSSCPKIIQGFIDKRTAETMLTNAWLQYRKESLYSFVIRFSESRPGWIALAANMEDVADEKKRVKHYRIEVDVTEHEKGPFKVNIGQKDQYKFFESLNAVLKKMNLKKLCANNGKTLIKRELIFQQPKYPG